MPSGFREEDSFMFHYISLCKTYDPKDGTTLNDQSHPIMGNSPRKINGYHLPGIKGENSKHFFY